MSTKDTDHIITILDQVTSFLCVLLTGVQLISYVFGIFPAMQHRTLFLGFVLSIILLIHIRNKLKSKILDIWEIFLLFGIIFSSSKHP